MVSLGPSQATRAGAALLVLGGVLAAGLALTTPFGGCTDVGVPPEADTGFAVRGVDGGDLVYSPDGANECRSPVAVAALPLAGVLGGSALLVYGRVGATRTGGSGPAQE
jgi:hypothetical protein